MPEFSLYPESHEPQESHPADHHHAAEVPDQPFYVEPSQAPTDISPPARSALDIQPETPQEAPPEAPERPVARSSVRERQVLDRLPLYVVDKAPGHPFQKIEAPDWLREDWGNMVLPERQEVRRLFQPQREGLDIARGDAFVRGLGMAATDTTIELPASQRELVQQAVGAETGDHGGLYAANIDVVFVFRSPELEAANGPGVTEKARVHELVHSDGLQQRVLADNGVGLSNYTTAGGYTVNLANGAQRNLLLGEGVPELIAGQYVAEVLNKPHGLADTPDDTCLVWTGHGEDYIRVPSRYADLSPHGEVMVTPNAFAAAVLDELITRDPALQPALIHGNHDLEARREAIGRIQAIHKGLYRTLRDSFNDDTTFDTALHYVRDVLDVPDN